MEKGTFYWVMGLSGAGKTTVGKLLYQHLKSKKDNVLFIDGDMLREVMDDHDFSEEGRDRTTRRNVRLVKLLTDQGLDIVWCAIGMKEKYRAWNREAIQNYKEIYLKVSIDELIHRDSKGMYKKALNHEIQNVYGIDLAFDEPKQPSVLVENEGDMTPQKAVEQIVAALGL